MERNRTQSTSEAGCHDWSNHVKYASTTLVDWPPADLTVSSCLSNHNYGSHLFHLPNLRIQIQMSHLPNPLVRLPILLFPHRTLSNLTHPLSAAPYPATAPTNPPTPLPHHHLPRPHPQPTPPTPSHPNPLPSPFLMTPP